VLYASFGAFMAACFVLPWKQATAYGSPSHATLVLLIAAALLNTLASLFPQLRARGESERPLGPTLWLALVFAVLSLAGNWSSAEAVSRISSALMSVLQRCEVLVVGLLGIPLLAERPSRAFWLGLVLAALGLGLLQGGGGTPAFDPLGVVYGLGGAVAFGAMIVLTRKYVAQVRLVPLNALRLWLGVALWFAIEREVPTAEDLPLPLVLNASLAAFFGPFLSRLGALFSARHVPASTTALASLSAPALTLLLSLLVFGTLPTSRELLGGAILLAGVAIPLAASAYVSDEG
jgi:probable blue pigment (indigoidine) exporter